MGLVLLVAVPIVLAIWLAVPPSGVDTANRAVEPKEVGRRTVTAIPVSSISVDALETMYDKAGFTIARVAKPGEDVPPIFVRSMPRDWLEVPGGTTRKRLFEKIMLPLVLKANADIRADRGRLLELMAESAKDDGSDLPAAAQQWLTGLAERYKTDGVSFAKLKARVDVIPVEMALAQAANESGWGSSRFARQGNALFGQWTWDASEAMYPKEQQKGKGNYGVKKFPTLGGSVAGYMRNLNTHSAYEPFRRRRAAQRDAGQEVLQGRPLVNGLRAYSQRGQNYIDEIQAMIDHNDYGRLADARLAATPPNVAQAARTGG